MDSGDHRIIPINSPNRGFRVVSSRSGGASVLSRFRATLRAWHRRRRDRQALSKLDERLLRDIGLTRDEAERQWTKPFWRP